MGAGLRVKAEVVRLRLLPNRYEDPIDDDQWVQWSLANDVLTMLGGGRS